MESPFSSSVCATFRGGADAFVFCGQHQKSVFHQCRHHRLYVNTSSMPSIMPMPATLVTWGFFDFLAHGACPLRLRFAEGIIHAVQHLNRTGADNGVAAEGGAVVTGNQGILCFFTEQHRTDRQTAAQTLCGGY